MLKPISAREAKTIYNLFRMRVEYSSDKTAYSYFDVMSQNWVSITWKETAGIVARWQAALKKENLAPGDCVGIIMRNCYEWVMFELAAFGLGLVTVPFYVDDKPDNILYILKNTRIKLLLTEDKTVEKELLSTRDVVPCRVVCLDQIEAWLPEKYDRNLWDRSPDPNELAAVYHTSGTTDRPKGVMLTHGNILSNAEATMKCITFKDGDVLVPYTGGYVLSMLADIAIAFPRSFKDLQTIRPTLIVSGSKLYEYVYGVVKRELLHKPRFVQFLFNYAVDTGWKKFEDRQGDGKETLSFFLQPLFDMLIAKALRKRFGGRVCYAFYAGANLSFEILKTFIGLGMPILKCYGQTEAGPVISVNRFDDNFPASVGTPISGIDVRIENKNPLLPSLKGAGELLVKGPGVMKGYWNNSLATDMVLDRDGWLHTGDLVSMDTHGRIFFIERMSDLIVMENGEYIAPGEIEAEITADLLFEHAMVLGKDKPFITALLVLNQQAWKKLAKKLKVNHHDSLALNDTSVKAAVFSRITKILSKYPPNSNTTQIRRFTLLIDQWTVQAGFLTPSAKLKRANLTARYKLEIEQMYADE